MTDISKTSMPSAIFSECNDLLATIWIVQLQEGCWLAPWRGDPGRTLLIENAKRFRTENGAKHALSHAKKMFPFRDFSDARVLANAEINPRFCPGADPAEAKKPRGAETSG